VTKFRSVPVIRDVGPSALRVALFTQLRDQGVTYEWAWEAAEAAYPVSFLAKRKHTPAVGKS
jgi:hypothetical protein